jgi:putative glutamine amidotransferase
MKRKPVIGIMGIVYKRDMQCALNIPMTFTNSAYCNAIIRNGGIPFIIPCLDNKDDLRVMIDMCDGLLLPGGDDVDPRLYGQEVHPLSGALNKAIDEIWIEAERMAEEKGIPIMGICRGMQITNVAHGGSLHQDISLCRPCHQLHVQKQNRDYLMHTVKIKEGSILSETLGTCEILTNTMHHQCVFKEGQDLKITAYAKDGIPEAMETDDGRILLVQWHPEELLDSEPRMNSLFSRLIEKSTKENV